VITGQLPLFDLPADDSTHACPGGCGRRVPRDLFACSACWYRLPAELRQAINDTYRPGRVSREHAAALAGACHWFDSHPRKG
jgi:hypothetical protein